MGISRAGRYKRRLTGGRRAVHQKKRRHELGRPPANTKLGAKRVHPLRVRGGAYKQRALRLDTGNFSWGSEAVSRKTRILDVVYNSTNNELVRTKTLVKGAIVQVDATPFRQWYEQHYDTTLQKKGKAAEEKPAEKKPKSELAQKKFALRKENMELEEHLKENFAQGRLYACVSSRPGQSGRCDGYILEQKELDFYLKKMAKKK